MKNCPKLRISKKKSLTKRRNPVKAASPLELCSQWTVAGHFAYPQRLVQKLSKDTICLKVKESQKNKYLVFLFFWGAWGLQLEFPFFCSFRTHLQTWWHRCGCSALRLVKRAKRRFSRCIQGRHHTPPSQPFEEMFLPKKSGRETTNEIQFEQMPTQAMTCEAEFKFCKPEKQRVYMMYVIYICVCIMYWTYNKIMQQQRTAGAKCTYMFQMMEMTNEGKTRKVPGKFETQTAKDSSNAKKGYQTVISRRQHNAEIKSQIPLRNIKSESVEFVHVSNPTSAHVTSLGST